jgi:hypothetical protein
MSPPPSLNLQSTEQANIFEFDHPKYLQWDLLQIAPSSTLKNHQPFWPKLEDKGDKKPSELLAQIQALWAQVNILTAATAPAALAAPAPVIFADTPQTLKVKNLINYGTTRGAEIYKQGCAPLDDKSLTDGFNMMPNQTIIFVEALQCRCTEMGWNSGSKNITSFQNTDGHTINIIKNYGQSYEATLHAACECFCAARANSKMRARLNNTMISICLAKSLTADAQERLLTYHNDVLIKDVECTPLKYKVIMQLAAIDLVATTQSLCNNLLALGTYASRLEAILTK